MALLTNQPSGQDRRAIDTSLLDAAREIAPIVRAHADEAERNRRLSTEVVDALRQAGLTRMTTPRSLGGLETDPVTRVGRWRIPSTGPSSAPASPTSG
jgi:alkylation response protein AidB-like acyl-CoA dehydrogenase